MKYISNRSVFEVPLYIFLIFIDKIDNSCQRILQTNDINHVKILKFQFLFIFLKHQIGFRISSQDVLCDADKPVSPALQFADEYLLN